MSIYTDIHNVIDVKIHLKDRGGYYLLSLDFIHEIYSDEDNTKHTLATTITLFIDKKPGTNKIKQPYNKIIQSLKNLMEQLETMNV